MWWLGWGSPLGLLAVGLFIVMLRGGRWTGRRTQDRGDALGASRSAELDELRARVAELEERQDFSERLLARKDAAAVREDR